MEIASRDIHGDANQPARIVEDAPQSDSAIQSRRQKTLRSNVAAFGIPIERLVKILPRTRQIFDSPHDCFFSRLRASDLICSHELVSPEPASNSSEHRLISAFHSSVSGGTS